MSHFTVLVINTEGDYNVDEQLDPYSENIEVAPYEVPLEDDYMLSCVKYYKEQLSKQMGDSNVIVSEPSMDDFDEIYCENANDWDGNACQKINGVWKKFSTYNPNSKWDWYEVGGRWAGTLLLKEGVGREKTPNYSWGWSDEAKLATPDNATDIARKGDIDWDAMVDVDAYERACRFWEIYIDGDETKNKEEETRISHEFYKREYYTDRYKDKYEYARMATAFSTFAVLKDGIWFEKGEMGWFGCSSDSGEEEVKWVDTFFDTFIKDLDDNALLTIVDCHI